MKINVTYMAQARKATGLTSEELELDKQYTVQEMIIKKLCKTHEKLGKYILKKDDTIRKIILIFVGNEKIEADIPVNLKDNDQITIMTPIAGG